MNGVLSALIFTTLRCPNCGPMKQTLNEYKSEYGENLNIILKEVDADLKAMELAREWGVQAVPTTIFLYNAEEIGKIVGNAPKKDVGEIIERFIQPEILREQSGRGESTSNSLLCDFSK